MITPIKETSQLLENLKEKGYKIYLLSNFYREAFSYIMNKFGYLRQVDGYLISFQARVMKPDEKIYKAFLAKFNLKPKECFFIDDYQANIEAAKKLGISGTSFENSKIIWNILEGK